jgi:hypothetical protein
MRPGARTYILLSRLSISDSSNNVGKRRLRNLHIKLARRNRVL